MERRDHFLLCTETDCEKFLEFFNDLDQKLQQQEKTQEKLVRNIKLEDYLCDILQELNKTQWNALWCNIQRLCEDALRDFAVFIRRIENPIESNAMEQSSVSIKLLEYVSHLCLAVVKLDNPEICSDLWSVVLILHGLLLSLSSIVPKFSHLICHLCVEWWCKNLPGKDDVCINAIIFLLNEVLGSGLDGKQNTSKLTSELYKLQRAFNVLSLDENCNTEEKNDAGETEIKSDLQELRQLLISCFLHPVFLKASNGRKFLAKILLLQKELMIAIHHTIMIHILMKINFSEAYGNIYYLAWNLADEHTKETIEECCIQDVMFRAMNACRSNNLFSAYQRFLLSISAHNGALHIRHMMTRLYNPIIWRSLKASNAMVRANAISLLFDNFPLANAPDNENEDKDAFLQKQFSIIEELMEDPYPQVRSIAISGMFNVLNLYWDVIPAEVIAIQCKKIYTNFAFDSASVAVRLAIFKGTVVLLNNPCSHPLLQKLLPVVGHCIHDSSEKVRIAFCEVLLAVKQTNSIKFWDVCPVENILAQLENEGQTGSKLLVKLIAGSFMPQDESPETWVKLCANFYQRNTGAARKFYLFAKDRLSVTELGEILFTLSVFIFNVVSKSIEDESQEQAHTDASGNISEQPHLIAGLLDTICILWTEFSKKLKHLSRPKERSALGREANDLRELSKKVMLQLPRMSHVCFRKYHDDRSLNALLYLSSCLQPASMPMFSKKVIPKLKNLPDDSPKSYYEMLIKCVAKWNWNKELLEMIHDWLATAHGKNEPDNQKKNSLSSSEKSTRKSKQKKGKGKSVQFTEEKAPPRPLQGLKYLDVLIGNEEVLNAIMSDESCKSLMQEISSCLQSYTRMLLSRMDGSTSDDDVNNDLLLEAFLLHCKLLAYFYLFHTKKQEDESPPSNAEFYLRQIKNMFENCRLQIVDELKSTAQLIDTQNCSMLSTTLQDANVTMQMNQSVIAPKISFIKNFIQISLDSILFFLKRGIPVGDEALSFVAAITETGVKTLDFAASVISLLYEIFECLLLYSWLESEDKKKQTEDEEIFLRVIDDVMLSLTTYSRSNRDGFALMFRTQLRPSVRSLIHIASKYSNGITNNFYASLTNKIISAALADISYHKLTASDTSFRTFDGFSDLPPFCAALLPITCHSSICCEYICDKTIIHIFNNNLQSENERQRELAEKACILLSKVLVKEGKNPTAARKCLEIFQKKTEESESILPP